MLFNPTESHVYPLLFQTGISTVKELVLALAIHDKNVTMTKTTQATFTVRTGPTLHLKTAELPKLTETMSLASPHSPYSGSSSRCQPTHDLHPRTPSLPSLPLRKGKKRGSLLEGHPGTTKPQTVLFPPEVTSPTCSKLFHLAPVAQKSNQDRTSHRNSTPRYDFHLLGNPQVGTL